MGRIFQCAAGFVSTIDRAIVHEARNAIKESGMIHSIWRPDILSPQRQAQLSQIIKNSSLETRRNQLSASKSTPKTTRSRAKFHFLETHFNQTYTLAACPPCKAQQPSNAAENPTTSAPHRNHHPTCRKSPRQLCAGHTYIHNNLKIRHRS